MSTHIAAAPSRRPDRRSRRARHLVEGLEVREVPTSSLFRSSLVLLTPKPLRRGRAHSWSMLLPAPSEGVRGGPDGGRSAVTPAPRVATLQSLNGIGRGRRATLERSAGIGRYCDGLRLMKGRPKTCQGRKPGAGMNGGAASW